MGEKNDLVERLKSKDNKIKSIANKLASEQITTDTLKVKVLVHAVQCSLKFLC